MFSARVFLASRCVNTYTQRLKADVWPIQDEVQASTVFLESNVLVSFK